jgi:hypothetical protein
MALSIYLKFVCVASSSFFSVHHGTHDDAPTRNAKQQETLNYITYFLHCLLSIKNISLAETSELSRFWPPTPMQVHAATTTTTTRRRRKSKSTRQETPIIMKMIPATTPPPSRKDYPRSNPAVVVRGETKPPKKNVSQNGRR